MKLRMIFHHQTARLRLCRPSAFITGFLISLAFLFAVSGCGKAPPAPDRPGETDVAPIPKTPETADSYRVNGQPYHPISDSEGFRQAGIASWYGAPFHGRKTANGETYNMHARTAAHKILPLGTFVLVRRLDTGKETVVRINDRGPFVRGRIIDLSYRAAKELGMIGPGTANVEVIAMEEGLPETEHADFYSGDFTVQVGAFVIKSLAEKLCNELQADNAQVFMESVRRESETFYRVRVGRFTSLASAKAEAARLLESGYSGAFAVARDDR